MATIDQDLAAIRTAVYGREVREAIADGIEHCYNDGQAVVNQSREQVPLAEAVIASANSAAANAQEKTDALTEKLTDYETNIKPQMEQSITDVQDALTTATGAIVSARTDALDSINSAATAIDSAKTDALDSIASAKGTADTSGALKDIADARSTAVAEITGIKTNAEEIATSARNLAQTATDDVGSLESTVAKAKKMVEDLEALMGGFINGGYVEDNALYLTCDDKVIAGPFKGIGGSGGGGGGSTNSALMTLDKAENSNWGSTTISTGSDLYVDLIWSSLDQGVPTGDGTLTISINRIVKATMNVPQGNVHLDIGKYVGPGRNTVTIGITDEYENYRFKNYTVQVAEISLESQFRDDRIYTSYIEYSYTPNGDVDDKKTVHFILDGTEIGTVSTGVSGRELRYVINRQAHGAHTLEVYFVVPIGGVDVESNHLYYNIAWADPDKVDPIVTSSYQATSIDQYSTIKMPFMVYTPSSEKSQVEISDNGVVVSSMEVNRDVQTFIYQMTESGSHTIVISSGNASKTFELEVTPREINVEPATTGLQFAMSSRGRTNNDPDRDIIKYIAEDGSEVVCKLEGFNWVSNGWVIGDNGYPVFRVNGGATVRIPVEIFADDIRRTGFTAEFEFTTKDVLNYDDTIISCMSGGIGFEITAQQCGLYGSASESVTQYKEEEPIRVSFVVEQDTGYARVFTYIDAIASSVSRYLGSSFVQTDPNDITIRSNNCTVDIANIRIYKSALSMEQIENNWVYDTLDGAEMYDRYVRNNIRENGKIAIGSISADQKYMVFEGPSLPQFKGNKLDIDGYYVNPEDPDKSFTFESAQNDVQGTSSQYYYRKNYKIKFKNGLMTNDKILRSKYSFMDNAIPVSTFCLKADVASSEGANNVELVKLYNDLTPYKTPAQLEDSRVRQGIDGFPILVFWHNTTTDETMFLGKYNFNNDKSTEEVFGFLEGDESWETLNNDTTRVTYKESEWTELITRDGETKPAWQFDFEARFPDTDPPYTNYLQLKEFTDWIVTTDPEQATNVAFDSPKSFGVFEDIVENGQLIHKEVTFAADTPEYRIAKFRAEAPKYMEMDSMIFYYIFTETFLMVDSRAKNFFPSFMGSQFEG